MDARRNNHRNIATNNDQRDQQQEEAGRSILKQQVKTSHEPCKRLLDRTSRSSRDSLLKIATRPRRVDRARLLPCLEDHTKKE